jgi:hypothetical protein
MEEPSERMRILDMIENGQISAEEGLRLLAELPEPPEPGELSQSASSVVALPLEDPGQPPAFEAKAAPGAGQEVHSEPVFHQANSGATGEQPLRPEVVAESYREDFDRWRSFWMVPLWIGVGLTIFSGVLMYWAIESAGIGFWFLCATIPFILGVLVMVIGAQSRTARWLHLRIKQAPGERPQRIAISFPIPIGLTIWFFHTFRHRIPGLDEVPVNIDELLNAVRDSATPENPVYIRVDEDEDGEKVEIFIG